MSVLDVVLGSAHRPLLIAALVLPTTRLVRVLTFLVILYADWHTYLILLHAPGPQGFQGYSTPAGMLGPIMMSIDFLLLTSDVRTTIKWRNPAFTENAGTNAEPARETSLSDVGFYQRIVRAASLSFNPRLIGTNARVAHVPALAPEFVHSRRKFCLDRTFTFFLSAGRMLVLYLLVIKVPFLQEAVLTPHPSFWQRAVHTTGGIVFTYSLLTLGHAHLSTLAVAFHISNPEDWPPLFGKVSDAYTVRRAWGRSWHQNYRKPFESISSTIAHSMLRLRPHTLPARYLKLLIAFACSGFAHLWGDFILYTNRLPSYGEGLDASQKIRWDALFSPQFFVMQAFGIMFEDAVVGLWGMTSRRRGQTKKVKGKKGTKTSSVRDEEEGNVPWYWRMVGYAWVFVWFCSTFPAYTRNVLIYVL